MFYSTRVSNALGAGNPKAAIIAVRAVLFLTVLETVIVSSILYASRHVFGYIFSNDHEVVDYVTSMAPLICLCVILNGLQAVLSGHFLFFPKSCSKLFIIIGFALGILEQFHECFLQTGIARGCGWQNLGAYANLTAYYLFGIPVAAALGFWLKMRGEGLWIGIQFGAFVQIVLLFLITSCQNWKKQVCFPNPNFSISL